MSNTLSFWKIFSDEIIFKIKKNNKSLILFKEIYSLKFAPYIYIYKFYINNIINFILIILILIKSEFPDEFFFNVKILLLLILY